MVDKLQEIVLHVGCGPAENKTLHAHFETPEWKEIRLDIDPRVQPDIVASLTDLRPVPSNSVDAVWSSHNLEHLLPHQVPVALREFVRVLKPDGFALILVPDLQYVAALVAMDRLDETAYTTPGGEQIAPHDMIFGWRKETATGNDFYCHRTGFTAKTLYWALVSSGFGEVLVQRDGVSLWATAYKQRPQQRTVLSGVASEIYAPAEGEAQLTGYRLWQNQHQPTALHKTLCERRVQAWPHVPRIHLAVLMDKADERMLSTTVSSLALQWFMPSQVTIIAPFPPLAGWRDSERLNWRTTQRDVLHEANLVLTASNADWIGVADAGDQFPPHAFFAVAEAANAHPGWKLIYSDEDRLNDDAQHDLPHFKPDFNPALLRGYPYIGGLMMVKGDVFARLGGFDCDRAGVEEYDLALRAWELEGERAFGHVADILYHRLAEGGHCRLPVSELVERGRAALAAHLERRRVPAEIADGAFPASYRVRYRVGQEMSASILVFADTDLAQLQRCIESVLAQTAWPNYEVVLLVDATCPQDVRTYAETLKSLDEPRLRVFIVDEALPWSDAQNRLAAESMGEFLVFLAASCAAMQADWIEELLGRAIQPGVAAVAPRLLKADGRIQQAGAILGLYNRPVDTPFPDETLDYPGYYGRALLAQNFSALPAACLVVRHGKFMASGGFDSAFAGDLAAADLCLRLAKEGEWLEWTPFASLLQSRETGIAGDVSTWATFYDRWLPKMARDPAYNPNLSLRLDFSVETLAQLSYEPLPWRPMPRILSMPADESGSGEYRVIAPGRALTRAMRAQVIESRSTLSPVEMERVAPDVLVMQRQIYDHQVEAIRRYARFGRAFRVFELDDLITNMPVKSALRPFMPSNAGQWMAEALKHCDRFVVSTPGLAEAYGDLHGDIRVVHNYLERARWQNLTPNRQAGRKPRVGWAGGNSHTGDLDVIAEVVKLLAGEVEWVFLGMCTDEIRPWLHENHAPVGLDAYPAKLASLNLDLALAPLEQHSFNECKSHLKLLEYGILGYPVIATDIRPYQGDYPIALVGNRVDDWVDAIRAHVADPAGTAARGDALREYVSATWMLEDHLDQWVSAWLP